MKNKIATNMDSLISKFKTLRQKDGHNNIASLMENQKEIDFFFSYYSTTCTKTGNPEWRRSINYGSSGFAHIRELALLAVARVDKSNGFNKQKVKDLTDKEFMLAVKCADEIAKVVAAYKQVYLESEDRYDIVEAFGMEQDQADDETTEIEDGIILCCGYDTGYEKDINFCPKCGKKIIKPKKSSVKYRNEIFYGTDLRDAVQVMMEEIFYLGNWDILEYISKNFLEESALKTRVDLMSNLLYCYALNDGYFNEDNFRQEPEGNWVHELYDSWKSDGENENCLGFIKDILDAISAKTGKNIKYVLWLCDTKEDVKKRYSHKKALEDKEIDAYMESDIVLSDRFEDGRLYGYEEYPIKLK